MEVDSVPRWYGECIKRSGLIKNKMKSEGLSWKSSKKPFGLILRKEKWTL